jgi:hypothetical protein
MHKLRLDLYQPHGGVARLIPGVDDVRKRIDDAEAAFDIGAFLSEPHALRVHRRLQRLGIASDADERGDVGNCKSRGAEIRDERKTLKLTKRVIALARLTVDIS